MPLYTAEALVLRTYKLGEADRIVVFLTRDRGKKRGVAHNARKSRKRFGAALEPLTEVRVSYFEKERRELVGLNYAEPVRSPLSAASPEALGYSHRLQGTGKQQVVVFLNPHRDPVLPLGSGLTLGRGWHPRPEDGVRWANDDAVLSYYNPYDRPLSCELRLELVGVTNREVVLDQNGRRVHAVQTGQEPVEMVLPQIKLAPGVNCFVLHSPEPARRLGTGRYQLRTFGLKASAFRVLDAPTPRAWSE